MGAAGQGLWCEFGFSYFLGCPRQGLALVPSQLPGTGSFLLTRLLPLQVAAPAVILPAPAPWFGASPLVWHQPASLSLHLPHGPAAAGLGLLSHGLCVSPLTLSGFLHSPAALVRGRNESHLCLHLSTDERRSLFSLGWHWRASAPQGNNPSPSENTHVAVLCVVVYCPFR